MILPRITDYLKLHRRAALTDMAAGLDITPEALRKILAVLERKGRILKLPTGTACRGCSKCHPESVELYEWID